jgi:hypothetical protein
MCLHRGNPMYRLRSSELSDGTGRKPRSDVGQRSGHDENSEHSKSGELELEQASESLKCK